MRETCNLRHASAALALSLALVLGGCDMAPRYGRPANPAPPQWPQGAAYGPADENAPGLAWRDLIGDARLRKVIETALAGNRDLRATLANVAAARAQYHVERSYQLPAVTAGADASATRGLKTGARDTQSYDANIGFSAFELDLFGRLRDQSKAAFESYLATQSGLRAARLTLVAETATAYTTLASDMDLLRIAQDTARSGQRSLDLNQSLFTAGLASAGDVQDAITVVEQAKSDIAAQTTLVAQDRNALELLAGGPLPDELIPQSLAELDRSIAKVPAGLSSSVLRERPDVVEAEHQLKASYAAIGEARAAFFPAISLTSALGFASSALSDLLKDASLTASGTASASLPLAGGTYKGDLEYARAERDYYRATYEATVLSAFRDVADALARRGTIADQRQAQARLVDAAARSYALADEQYRAGAESYITALSAQRTLYAARDTQVAAILADVTNRVTLYAAIGADASLQ